MIVPAKYQNWEKEPKVGSGQVRGRARKAIQGKVQTSACTHKGSKDAPAISVSVENGERQGFKLGG